MKRDPTVAASRQSAATPAGIRSARLSKRRHAGLGALRFSLFSFYFLLSAFNFRASGQGYSIDWYKVSGGGGTSTGGTYSVSGTIGQPDASGPMTGGSFAVTGGFWSLVNLIQTPGVPKLILVGYSPNSVKILWPDPATNTYTLQQIGNLAGGSWTTSGYPMTNGFGTNFVTITPPAGNLFFRLKQ